MPQSSRRLDQGEAGLAVLDLAQMRRTFRHDHFEGRSHARFAEMSSFRAAIAGADHNVYMQRGRAIRAFRNVANQHRKPVPIALAQAATQRSLR